MLVTLIIIALAAHHLRNSVDIQYLYVPTHQYIVGCEKISHVNTILHAWKHDGLSGRDAALSIFYEKNGAYGGTQCWGTASSVFVEVTQVATVALPGHRGDYVQVVISEAIDPWGYTYHTISNLPIKTIMFDLGESVEK